MKPWITPMEESYFLHSATLEPVTLLKVKLFHGCFSLFLNCAIVQIMENIIVLYIAKKNSRLSSVCMVEINYLFEINSVLILIWFTITTASHLTKLGTISFYHWAWSSKLHISHKASETYFHSINFHYSLVYLLR